MLGFSGKQFVKEVTDFAKKNGVVIADKITTQGSDLVRKAQEKIFPELKGYSKTPTVDGEYKFIIIMAGIKKENAKVRKDNNNLFVTGWNNDKSQVVIDFKQHVGNDEIVSAKLEDGVMTVTLKESSPNKEVNID
jgi:HSP20 family molecular chaperone IbpA